MGYVLLPEPLDTPAIPQDTSGGSSGQADAGTPVPIAPAVELRAVTGDRPAVGAALERTSPVCRSGSPNAGERPAPADDPHIRRVRYGKGHWHFLCQCGYVSPGFVSQARAETWPCPVEELLVESRIRLRLLHGE